MARELTTLGYTLLPEYEDVFNVERNDEVIYAVPSNEASPNWYIQEIMPPDFATGGDITRTPGWYGFWMPWDFFDKYQEGDERLETIISSYTTTSGTKQDRDTGMRGAIPLKFTDIPNDNSTSYGFDQPVFRYAEVLLSLAEAINEQRGPGEALPFANEVRARAELDPWSGLSKDQLRDSLLEERGREFFGEGLRRQDLIRHDKFIELARTAGITNAEPHHVLFSIPQEVISASDGIIEQNPGY